MYIYTFPAVYSSISPAIYTSMYGVLLAIKTTQSVCIKWAALAYTGSFCGGRLYCTSPNQTAHVPRFSIFLISYFQAAVASD